MKFRQLRHLLSPKRFMVQLLVILLIFTFSVVLALGIPAALLLNEQTRDHVHTLLAQSSQTSQTLIENKQAQLQNLAMLLANRPTLITLVGSEADSAAISTYLSEFQQNLNTSLILMCKGNESLAVSDSAVPQWLCAAELNGLIIDADPAWIVAQSALSDEIRILVGQQVEAVFDEFSAQSGLTYVLTEGRQLVANNVPTAVLDLLLDLNADARAQQILSLVGDSGASSQIMAAEIPFPDQPDYQWLGVLDATPYLRANTQLRTIILISLVVVSIVAAVLSVLIARRISRPLSRLATSAARLREGNLDTRITTISNLWEVDQLANALEDARVSLGHSLNQIQKEKIWIEDLLNSIVEGLLTLDERDRVTFASHSTTRITGQSPGEILGQPIDSLFKSPAGEDPFSHQIPESSQLRRIPVVVGGEEVLLAVSRSEFIPPDAGNATRTLMVRDVTDEERIHHLIGEFLANITHEFRTPLAALSASLELLVEELPELSEPEIDQLLRAVNIGIVNLQSLIDNLIEAASIEAGRFKVNPQPVDLNLILNEAITTMQPIARLHQVTISRSNPKSGALVNADQRRTVQVLINLISNAIKHSPEGSQIIIRSMQVQKTIMVEVEDQGAGIPELFHPQIFNRFFSPVDGSKSPQLGLGLGLSVVKAIVETQNGKVGFRNASGGGALFWFTLPIAAEGDT